MSIKKTTDALFWYMTELSFSVVAKYGQSSDRFHFGKIILEAFKDAPEFILQIDAATNKSVTNGTVLEKSVRCALRLRNMGLKSGDVIVLSSPTHTDLTIPFYAALYLGLIIAPVDRTFGINELQNSFEVIAPKIIFCQSEKTSDIQKALKNLKMNSHIVTFDKGTDDDISNLNEFLKLHENVLVKNFNFCSANYDESFSDAASTKYPYNLTPVVNPELLFIVTRIGKRAADFNAEEAIGFLIPTSGTTGLPKIAALTYKSFYLSGINWWARYENFPTPTPIALIFSPVQWLTWIINMLTSACLRYTLLQTSSSSVDADHIRYIINTYHPTHVLFSPTMMTSFIKAEEAIQGCDFSSFETVLLGGSAVSQKLVEDVKRHFQNAEVLPIYGLTEISGLCLQGYKTPPGSSGRPIAAFKYRLVNTESGKDVCEPNVNGELWLKGPGVFKYYYKNPQATKEAFSQDGWLKTGDIFYRDENWNLYFVDRLKLMLKFKNHQISPVELETVIRQHPSVADVAVTGIQDPVDGDLPVACVVLRKDHTVTAQEIKDLVKDSLSDSKHLRGGVIFIKEFPLTPSSKINRPKIKELALKFEKQ